MLLWPHWPRRRCACCLFTCSCFPGTIPIPHFGHIKKFRSQRSPWWPPLPHRSWSARWLRGGALSVREVGGSLQTSPRARAPAGRMKSCCLRSPTLLYDCKVVLTGLHTRCVLHQAFDKKHRWLEQSGRCRRCRAPINALQFPVDKKAGRCN